MAGNGGLPDGDRRDGVVWGGGVLKMNPSQNTEDPSGWNDSNEMPFAKRATSLTLLGNNLAIKASEFTSIRALPLLERTARPLSGGVLGGVGGAAPRMSVVAIALSRMRILVGEGLGVDGPMYFVRLSGTAAENGISIHLVEEGSVVVVVARVGADAWNFAVTELP